MTSRLERTLAQLEPLVSEKSLGDLQAILAMERSAVWDLHLTPIEEVFSAQERSTLETMTPQPYGRSGLKRQMVIILKATRLCNLRCTYCNAWREGPNQIMEFSVLAKLIREILATQQVQNVDFVWHGGEVTLLPTSYLKKALWLQQHYCLPQTTVANSIQTNATRLTPEWLSFLRDYGFGVGVSIDGPPEIHDKRRVTKSGRGTWRDVKRGIDLLREFEIPFGALAVIDECALELGAAAYLRYLVDIGVTQVALLNALPPNSTDCAGTAAYVPHDRFTGFLRDLFAAWWSTARDAIEIRELQALVEAVARGTTGLCIFNDNCMGQYLTIDPNGDVSACDKYVGDPAYMFGNLRERNLNEMLEQSTTLAAAHAGVAAQKRRMSACPHYKICFGGCPHDVRLSEKYRPEWQPDCCGLSELIDDISLAVSGNVAGAEVS